MILLYSRVSKSIMVCIGACKIEKGPAIVPNFHVLFVNLYEIGMYGNEKRDGTEDYCSSLLPEQKRDERQNAGYGRSVPNSAHKRASRTRSSRR